MLEKGIHVYPGHVWCSDVLLWFEHLAAMHCTMYKAHHVYSLSLHIIEASIISR